jgi:hypothetical protein
MFNDEYNAPVGHLRTMIRRVYATREEAEEVLERLHRDWLRDAPDVLQDQVWEMEDRSDLDALVQLLRQLSPDEDFGQYDLTLPHTATDDQLDEIVRVGRISLAEIHEIQDQTPPPDEEVPWGDEVDYGSPALYRALSRYQPAPWPPPTPTRDHLDASEAGVQVAWDWVAAHPADAGPVARSEARQRARALGLSWHHPVHRALVTYAPDVEQLRELLQRV